MRYPRNVKIFRGQIDAAPFAGLFFMLVLFVMLFATHVFIPGVRIDLFSPPPAAEIPARTVKLVAGGGLTFQENAYDLAALRAEFQERARAGTLPQRLILDAEPSIPETDVDRVEQMLNELGITVKTAGDRLELPDDAGFAGSPNASVVVGLNLNGQIFFQHQRTLEPELQEKLTLAAERSNGPLTMVLQADKGVPYEKIMRLCQIARKAGVREVTLAHRPPLHPADIAAP